MSSNSEESIMARSTQTIKEQAFHMKHALDNDKILDGLKHANDMVAELRTGALGPKNYFELYIIVEENLRFLASYLHDACVNSKRKVRDLYELVQYSGSIVPRLYLLVTVGSVYIKSKEGHAKDVLHDLKEMCKGVQHPTRGLFLRSFLAEMTKDKLPDEGSEYAGELGGSVEDCVALTMENFVEMNKLWVRMQHQGGVRDRAKREKERKELGPLIGKMLSRLANLEGMSAARYSERVLPTIVEQIVSCRDVIAQEYLLTCLVQVFPDEYHLRTLRTVLGAVEGLSEGVDVRAVLVSFIERLVTYVKGPQPLSLGPDSPDLFALFYECISRVTTARPQLPPDHLMSLYTALMDLTIQVYPESLENVDRIFAAAAPVLAQRDQESLHAPKVSKALVALLHSPLDNYRNILTVLRLSNYPKLFTFLAPPIQRSLCLDVVRSTVRDAVPLRTPEQCEALLALLAPLVLPTLDPDDLDDEDLRDLAADQDLLGSLVHLMRAPEGLVALKQLAVVRKFLGMGGPLRIARTIPILVCRALAVAAQIHAELDESAWAATGPKVFKFVLSTCKTFAEHVDNPILAFRLFILAAQTAAASGREEDSYEFFVQAFSVYEESIPDSHDQLRALLLAIAALHSVLDSFHDDENKDALVTKVAQHSKRVLKKGDQVLLISNVAHLFWRANDRDSQRVAECLKRSLKLATNLTQGSPDLLVHVLNKYVYFLQNDNDQVTPEVLTSLLELVGGNVAEQQDDAATKKFQATLAYINEKKAQDPSKWGARE